MGKVYSGKVTSIKPFGCFVSLEGLEKDVEGLCHISELRSESRVSDVTEVVKRFQPVKVKVLSFSGTRTSLSLKDVDQETGNDLNPARSGRLLARPEIPEPTSNDLSMRNPDNPNFSGIKDSEKGKGDFGRNKTVAKLSDMDRWEIKQLVQVGLLIVTLRNHSKQIFILENFFPKTSRSFIKFCLQNPILLINFATLRSGRSDRSLRTPRLG